MHTSSEKNTLTHSVYAGKGHFQLKSRLFWPIAAILGCSSILLLWNDSWATFSLKSCTARAQSASDSTEHEKVLISGEKVPFQPEYKIIGKTPATKRRKTNTGGGSHWGCVLKTFLIHQK
jgi:hypothetical protein